MTTTGSLTAAELLSWLELRPETTPETALRTKDTGLSLSSTLVRATWRGRHTLAVSSDAAPVVQTGALLDLLAWHLHDSTAPGIERDKVTLLLIADIPEATKDAIRTLRDSVIDGPNVEILIQTGDGSELAFVEDTTAAPNYAGSARAHEWSKMLDSWSRVTPTGSALHLAELVADDRLRLYPMLSEWRDRQWSIRIDGLEVGQANHTWGKLNVGQDGRTGGRSGARTKWLEVWPAGALKFAEPNPPGAESVEVAAERIQALIAAFQDGAGDLDHGQAEHRLESQVLRGIVPVAIDGKPLERSFDDPLVSRGSQFPTLWGNGGRARYLDALLRRGHVPWAVELKVFGGSGSGAYYRHGLAQAVLYRHFIRSAVPLHSLFAEAGMDAVLCEACVGLPRATAPPVSARIGALRTLGELFGIPIVELEVDAAETDTILIETA